jgi:hypothetical protein
MLLTAIMKFYSDMKCQPTTFALKMHMVIVASTRIKEHYPVIRATSPH